jgi:LPXTG-motif cell wall-anchored protein
MIDGACVLGEKFTRQPSAVHHSPADPSVLGISASRELPFTGSPVSELLGVGIVALLVGTAAVVAGRRRRSA